MGAATVEYIAIQGVMAGCYPEYLPVLIAAAEAVGTSAFHLQAIQSTTNPAAVWLIVNGPIAKWLEMNSGAGCLGPGTWANATLGRALRLMLLNIGGGSNQFLTFTLNEQDFGMIHSPIDDLEFRAGTTLFAESTAALGIFTLRTGMIKLVRVTPDGKVSAIDDAARVIGVKLVKHSEPIVLIGIPDAKVKAMVAGYVGLDLVAEFRVGEDDPRDEGAERGRQASVDGEQEGRREGGGLRRRRKDRRRWNHRGD